jgi:hypothetical protein
VDIDPFPRSAPAGEVVRLKFRLKGGLRSPVLVVIYPAGPSEYIEPDVSAGNEYQIPFRLDVQGGTHRLSIIGRGPHGDRYVAEFIVKALSKDGKEIDRDVAIPPAYTDYPPLDPEEHPLRLERRLYFRMNALRTSEGMAPLPWHEGVARSSREQIVEIERYWEETFDKRTGVGKLLHRVPGAGPDGAEGPTIAERVRLDLAWPLVVPTLPRENPERGHAKQNFVAETITAPSSSLDRKFEQEFLRYSDQRAPLLSPYLTHAAGAATWRWYGWRKGTGDGSPRPTEPGPAPPGPPREMIATLVFVQVNDPAAAESYERDRKDVQRALSAASKPAERADALRRLGQTALPESPKLLLEAAKARDPAVLAGAVDGLWLCAPEDARRLSDPLQVLVLQSFRDQEESRAAEALHTLAAVRYDAASRKAGAAGLLEVAKRARAALEAAGKAAEAGKLDEARSLVESARGRFTGYPEEEDILAYQRVLARPGGPPPSK